MDVDLGRVDGIAAMGSVHFLVRDALVVEVAVLAHVEAVAIPRNGLQKRRAARPGRAQNHTHLPGKDEPVELAQNVEVRAATGPPSATGDERAGAGVELRGV